MWSESRSVRTDTRLSTSGLTEVGNSWNKSIITKKKSNIMVENEEISNLLKCYRKLSTAGFKKNNPLQKWKAAWPEPILLCVFPMHHRRELSHTIFYVEKKLRDLNWIEKMGLFFTAFCVFRWWNEFAFIIRISVVLMKMLSVCGGINAQKFLIIETDSDFQIFSLWKIVAKRFEKTKKHAVVFFQQVSRLYELNSRIFLPAFRFDI